MTDSELLTPRQAAERLAISTRQVHRLIGVGPGKLTAVRIGPRTIRIYRTSVERVLAEGVLHDGR